MATMKSFASDNYAGVLPDVMNALLHVNEGHAASYGNDAITATAIAAIRDFFETDAEVLFVFNGTGANVLSIAAATQSFHSVLCTDVSHIYNDESSAPETFTGCRFFPIPANDHGKLTPDGILKRLYRKGDVHSAQCKLISITQSTEYGTVYKPEEIKAITSLARGEGMAVHMDGARFFNALASLNVHPKEITYGAGVDILSLGGTKAGLMFGEAVVVFNEDLKTSIRFQQKQMMQLSSKTRFIATQFQALLRDDYWKSFAIHANKMAKLLCSHLDKYRQIRVTMPVQANAVFATLPKEWINQLQAIFPFYVWNEQTHEVRLMCSWDTTEEDVIAFSEAVARLHAATSH